MLRIKHQYAPHLAVGQKKAVAVVESQAGNQSKAGMHTVLYELEIFGFGVEDENGMHFAVGHIKAVLGIHSQAVGRHQLK